MIVRILNNKQDTDRFYDCRNACMRKPSHEDNEGSEFVLDLEFVSGETMTVTVGLAPWDEVYYMNDAGNTIHADCRMCKPPEKVDENKTNAE